MEFNIKMSKIMLFGIVLQSFIWKIYMLNFTVLD